MDENIRMTIEELAKKVEQSVPEAHCQLLAAQNQVVVRFSTRSDIEVSLLTPMLQKQLRAGYIDQDSLSTTLFELRRIISG